jgi:dipeptide/tripeptide permease
VSRSRTILIFGGLALAVWGMFYGIFYAVFIEHQTLDGLGSALAAGFVRAAERRMPESQAALVDAAQRSFIYVRQVDVHGHWVGLAILLLILGIGFDRVEFEERMRLWIAIALLAGSVLFPLGVLMEIWNRDSGPKILAVLGSALVIAGMCATAWGFARSTSGS